MKAGRLGTTTEAGYRGSGNPAALPVLGTTKDTKSTNGEVGELPTFNEQLTIP